MPQGGSWYEQGFDGVDQEQRRLEEMQGPGRIWIPPGAAKELVIIDDEPVCLHEHNPKMNGSYRNWFTCLQGVSDEVVCCQVLGPQSRYYCGYLTVVDCTEWVDGKGNKHQFEMRLLQLKLKSLKKLRRKKEDKGALVGTMWKFLREDDSSPICGDDWSHMRDVDVAKMFSYVTYRGKKLSQLWDDAESNAEAMAKIKRTFQIDSGEDGKLPRIVPAFNYFQVLQPKAPKDLRLQLVGVEKDDDDDKTKKGSSSGGGGGSVKAEDVPF
jgi:hypothetical protein